MTHVILLRMKTAISIPDAVFRSADQLAQRLGVSRSELYAKAIAELVEKNRDELITERLNEVYATEDSSLDDETALLQYRSLTRRSRKIRR